MAVNLYEPFTNPVTRETFRCLSSTDEAYTMEWVVQPSGYVPFEHIHLNQDEVFHVRQGSLRLMLNGREQRGTGGQVLTVPRGARHIACNDASQILDCIVEYKPGLDMAGVFQCFAGLTADHETRGRYGIHIPKMMYFMQRMKARALARPANLPGPLFRLLLNLFYAVGVLAGWENLYRKYTQ